MINRRPSRPAVQRRPGQGCGRCYICCVQAGGWGWFIVREKYCWLAGGWWLVLNWCERKALLAGWCQPAEQGRSLQPSYTLLAEWREETMAVDRPDGRIGAAHGPVFHAPRSGPHVLSWSRDKSDSSSMYVLLVVLRWYWTIHLWVRVCLDGCKVCVKFL
jgi:hypothetical protein